MDMNLGKLWEMVRDRKTRHAEVQGITVRHDLVTEQQKVHIFSMISLMIGSRTSLNKFKRI